MSGWRWAVKKNDIVAETVVAASHGLAIGCPLCGHDQVRPVRVKCNPAGTTAAEVAIDADGVHINKSAELCKGVAITVEMRCAQGHAFMWMFAHTHGRTVLASAINPPKCPERAIWSA